MHLKAALGNVRSKQKNSSGEKSGAMKNGEE